MTGWIVHTLVSTTLLMLLVLAVRRPVAQHFGARAAYALWALPLLRLLLPPIPGWTAFYQPVARVDLDQPPVIIGIVDAATAADYAESLPPMMQPEPMALHGWLFGLETGDMLLAVWAMGALLWFGWQVARYRRFLALALAGATRLTRSGGTDVFISDAVAGPMAAGIIRPRIFLPADFRSRYSPAEQRLALLHEGAHHDRGDLLANFAGLAVVALHWWNPIAHYAWGKFRTDQELACDATVLSGAAGAERQDYAMAVLKSACTRTPTAACAMNQKTQLKQRIGMMKDMDMTPRRMIAGGVTTLLLIGGGLLLTAAGNVAPVASPAPPAPPAAPAPPEFPAHVDADAALAEADAARAEADAARSEADAARAEAEMARAEAEAERSDARAQADAERNDAWARAEAERNDARVRAEAERADAASEVRYAANAMAQARESVRLARRTIERDRNLGPAERSQALAGLDEALRELDENVARARRK